MANLQASIRREVEELFPEIERHYRYLHRHPELSYREENTSRYVVEFLETEGIPYRKNIGGYGILASIRGEKPDNGKTIAFVADMDALPVHEKNDLPFKSQTEGVMHACGHDSHTASLMGAAKLINRHRADFGGRVLLVFQPGEEKSPGGADLMLKDGLFDECRPDFIVKQHAYIDLPAGKVAFQTGTVMASADEVHIAVLGQGGHGAVPHQLNDTVLAAAQTIVALQQVVSRRSNPFSPCVLSFGKFIAAGATNIIPSEVTLAGSLRCMDEQERMRLKTAIASIVQHTIEAFGCQYSMTLNDGYPCVFNQPTSTRLLRSYAEEYLSARQVAEMPPKMTAEDFGFFSQRYPSVYYRFGTAGELPSGRQHSSTFLIDEQALRTASAMPAYLALRWGKQ